MKKSNIKDCFLIAASSMLLLGFGACTFYDSSVPLNAEDPAESSSSEKGSSEGEKLSSSEAKTESSSSAEKVESSSSVAVGKENFDEKKMVFKDPRDKREYKVVEIEGNLWFQENLAYKMKGVLSYEDFDGPTENVKEFGYLYTENTLKDACPEGSHISTEKEWNSLIMDSNGKFKNTKELLVGGSTGFEAKLGGMYDPDEDYSDKDARGYWFIMGESSVEFVSINTESNEASMAEIGEDQAVSIRCVVNEF